MSDPVLVLDHVKKTFGDFTAVHDMSLSIPRGSVYGFLGPNGAGRTTTIRMTLAIYAVTAGTISILGKPSALASELTRIPFFAEPFFLKFNAERRFRIAMVAEDLTNAGLEEIGKKWR